MINVLFVCLGNICRSTMAEAVMRHKINEAGLSDKITVDSAGTSNYNIGDPPHNGTRKKLDEHSISYSGITARQLNTFDFERFEYMICMDSENYNNCMSIAKGDEKGKIHYLADFTPDKTFRHGKEVPDPYYTGNFELTFELVNIGCDGLMKHIREVNL